MKLYLLINILSISVPFIFSYHPKIAFYKQFRYFFPAMLISGLVYLSWDIVFTKLGVWGFNEDYLVGFYLANLPIEEILFFICIPFASVFTHYTITELNPNFKLSDLASKWITRLLIIILSISIVFNTDKAYTTVNAICTLLILLFAVFKTPYVLKTFYLTFLIVLIPFLIVNGILTGSFIPEEVVWYNNAENLATRVFTIPVEDFGYAFGMLLLTVVFTEIFSGRARGVSKSKVQEGLA
jgi:lycopene cyclase domain-containing protein